MLLDYMVKMTSFHISCYLVFYIWSHIEAIIYKTWILKIPENGFDFRLFTIFQTETETEI